MPDNVSLSGWVVQNKKPLFVYDINKDERFLSYGKALPYPACSYIGAPLIVKDKCIGLIRIITYQYIDFSNKQMELLVNLANEASVAIENARLYEQHKQSEEKYISIISNIKDIIFILNEIGAYTYISPQCMENLGYSTDELIGKVFIPLIHPEDLSFTVHSFKKTIEEKEEKNLLIRFIRKDKKIVWHSIKISPIIEDEKVTGIIGVSRDVTEMKELSHLLQKSEEKFKKIFEHSPFAIATINKRGYFETINPAFIKIFGVSNPEDYLNKTNLLDPNTSNDSSIHTDLADLLNGKPFERYGFRHISLTSHNELYLNIKGVPLFDEQNEVNGALIISEDITERKKSEDNILYAQKMQSIGTLAGGIAHNLNNILGGILGYASLTKSEINEGSELYSRLDTIERSSIRAANLVSELLTFSRAGKFDLTPSHINNIINDLIDILKESFDKNIQFKKLLAPDVAYIKADKNQIFQALMNIFINSRDELPNGGTINITTSNITLDETFCINRRGLRPGDYVKVSISDTGPGIPDDIKERIFEPFFSTKGMGQGLGLATVYGIIKNHNAYIECESEVGKGSTFTIYFPQTEPISEETKETSTKVKGGNETILIVDDEKTLRQLLKTSLTKLGYEIITASDGIEALEIYQKEKDKIDLVILDLIMPKLSAKETFSKLKNINENVKVILTSGYALNESVKQLFSNGVIDFVKKPYNIPEIDSSIRKLIDF